MSKNTPSAKLNSRSKISTMASRVAPSNQGSSRLSTFWEKGRGATIAVIPSTNPILAILDPMALPIAKIALPSNAAINATTISGADVPSETTVSPMTIFETPRFVAVAAAPDKKRSALQINTAKPTIINSKLTHMGRCPSLLGSGRYVS